MNQSLVSLDLSDCELATESVIAFATVLLTNTRLQRLGLANPRLFSLQASWLAARAAGRWPWGPKSWKAHAHPSFLPSPSPPPTFPLFLSPYPPALAPHARLSPLQEEPLVHVASMLRVNATLTALDLSKHGIRDEGARVLCADLQGNQTLRHLTLRWSGDCMPTPAPCLARLCCGSATRASEETFEWTQVGRVRRC